MSKKAARCYLLFTHCSVNSSRSKYDFYRQTDCMKRFCADLRKYEAEIGHYKKRKILPQTDKENESCNNETFSRIFKVTFHDVHDNNYDSNDDNNDIKEFDAESFMGMRNLLARDFKVPVKIMKSLLLFCRQIQRC